MLALFGVLVWEFEVSVPPFAASVFHGGAGMYGLLTSAIGLGAIVGAIVGARAASPTNRAQVLGAAICGVGLTAAALAPNIGMSLAGFAVAGAGLTAWYGILTAHFQLLAEPGFQARCMALWATALNGARPVGGPLVGAVGEVF